MRGHCGLDCELCDAYTATMREDPALLALVAREWSRNGQQYSAGDVRCDGCKAEGGRLFAWCAHCPIRQCCSSRALVHCGVCEDFPCGTVYSTLDRGAIRRLRSLPQS